jgi:hypothetical protein
MRILGVIILVVGLVGCAAQRPSMQTRCFPFNPTGLMKLSDDSFRKFRQITDEHWMPAWSKFDHPVDLAIAITDTPARLAEIESFFRSEGLLCEDNPPHTITPEKSACEGGCGQIGSP